MAHAAPQNFMFLEEDTSRKTREETTDHTVETDMSAPPTASDAIPFVGPAIVPADENAIPYVEPVIEPMDENAIPYVGPVIEPADENAIPYVGPVIEPADNEIPHDCDPMQFVDAFDFLF